MPKIELTNMVMIRQRDTGKVLVQNRAKSWKGISFPGGHVEDGESVVDSAVREVREETGLTVHNLKSCGMMHWSNSESFDRYFVFLFRTGEYSGEPLPETEEGEVFWADLKDLEGMKLAPNFREYLPMFLNARYSEAFGSWRGEEPFVILCKGGFAREEEG